MENITIERKDDGTFDVTANGGAAMHWLATYPSIGVRNVAQVVEAAILAGFTIDERYGEYGHAPKKVVDKPKRQE